MLLKCCIQYASKFGKFCGGHRTGKSQFSFQSQRRAIPNKVQTSIQLHWFHMLAKLCWKSFKLDFRSTWTENFWMYKLYCIAVLYKRQRNQRSNCQHFLNNGKSKGIPRKHLLLLPILHIDFSRGRSGGLVFPSLSEFSTVYCYPHSQRLWHSQ